MIWSTDPSKKKKLKELIPTKCHDKAVLSNILSVDLNKISEISILQSADKQGNPSFYFHVPGSKRRYPCTQTASAVSNTSPVSSNFVLVIASDMNLNLESEKRAKNVDFTQLKISRYKQHFFAIFTRFLIN